MDVVVYSEAVDFEEITVEAAAVNFTASNLTTHPQPSGAVLTLEDADIRFRVDGTDPTSAIGTLMEIGDSVILRGKNNLHNFAAIRDGGIDGTLRVIYLI